MLSIIQFILLPLLAIIIIRSVKVRMYGENDKDFKRPKISIVQKILLLIGLAIPFFNIILLVVLKPIVDNYEVEFDEENGPYRVIISFFKYIKNSLIIKQINRFFNILTKPREW